MSQTASTEPQKVILITGASKGIGLAIARRFMEGGFHAIICASTNDSLAEAQTLNSGLETHLCDVADPEAIERMAQLIIERHGALDVLVNNAGVYRPGSLLDEPDGALEQMFLTNVLSAYRVTRKFAPGMIERRRGHIFNMCSTASITPYLNGGSYGVSKHALLGFSKTLREEMKAFNTRVTTVLPGATLTASWDGVLSHPPERLMPPEDIAEAVWSAHALSERSVVEEILIRPLQGDLP